MAILQFYKRKKNDSPVVFLLGLHTSHYVFKSATRLYLLPSTDLKQKGSYCVIIHIYKSINRGPQRVNSTVDIIQLLLLLRSINDVATREVYYALDRRQDWYCTSMLAKSSFWLKNDNSCFIIFIIKLSDELIQTYQISIINRRFYFEAIAIARVGFMYH